MLRQAFVLELKEKTLDELQTPDIEPVISVEVDPPKKRFLKQPRIWYLHRIAVHVPFIHVETWPW